jgi:hypothetical protein
MNELALHAAVWTGFALLVIAVGVSNVAFFNLNGAVNKAYDRKQRIDPWSMAFRPPMKAVFKRIRLYKAAYGNGPFWRRMKFAYWMAGIGLVLVIAGSWLQKK